MCVYMGVSVDACFQVKSDQEHEALVIADLGYVCVYICYVDSETNYHRCKL